MKKKWNKPEINEINICETADTGWGSYCLMGMSGINTVPDSPKPGELPNPRPGKPIKPGNNGNHFGHNKR